MSRVPRGFAGGTRKQHEGQPAAPSDVPVPEEYPPREGALRKLFPASAFGGADFALGDSFFRRSQPTGGRSIVPALQRAKRLGRSWWLKGLGGGTVTDEQHPGGAPSPYAASSLLGPVRTDNELLEEVLCETVADALRSGRLSSAATPAERPALPPGNSLDLLSALPPDVKRRLALLYLCPRSLAALSCTCRSWRAISLGPQSYWKDKLTLLQLVWPAAALDERLLDFYGLQEPPSGEDATGTLWLRRYARAQALANKLSATSCDVAGARGFHARMFSTASQQQHVQTGWDLLPGERCGSVFANVALCRRAGGHAVSLDEAFNVTGTMTLQPGTYMLRWRVKTSRGSSAHAADSRPALWVSATATAVPMSARSNNASAAAKASSATAAGLAATSLMVATAGIAAPVVVMAAALGAAVAAGGAVAATVASNAFASGAGRNTPALLLPAPGNLLAPSAAGAVRSAVTPDTVRAAIASARGSNSNVPTLELSTTPMLHAEGLWRVDLESNVSGWRYVPVCFIQVASQCVVRVTISQRNTAAPVTDLALDYAEFVPLHEDVFRVTDPALEPVDTQMPALVQFGNSLSGHDLRMGTQDSNLWENAAR